MAPSKKILEYLDKENVEYEVLEHPPAYTAQEIAGAQHVPGNEVVKAVIVKAGGKPVMCVLPSIHMIDFDSLKKLLGDGEIVLAQENEIAELFPEYEVGAEPPFGHLHGMKVYADQFLENDEEIVFNAGTHTDMVKMKFSDFKRLANPVIARFGTHI